MKCYVKKHESCYPRKGHRSYGFQMQLSREFAQDTPKGLRHLEEVLSVWKASLSHGKHFNTLKRLLI